MELLRPSIRRWYRMYLKPLKYAQSVCRLCYAACDTSAREQLAVEGCQGLLVRAPIDYCAVCTYQVPQWSRIGRLKRDAFPKLTGGGHTFGGGAGAGALKTLAGRLLCDTYLSARELVKEVDYTLSTLAGSLLKQQRSELSSADVPGASM